MLLFSGNRKTIFSFIIVKMYTDAHIHLFDCRTVSGIDPDLSPDMTVCASAHDKNEFLWQEAFARRFPARVFLSFGIHPQEPVGGERPFLESLVAEKRISAIGECGFDLYSPEFRERIAEQESVWDFQLSLAVDSALPLVIHCRKALNRIFADSKRLKKVRSVIFHGWPGSAREAESLLDRGVNAWFCAGKGLLRGDRSLVETVRLLPVDRILAETDAPYMKSKDEPFSVPQDIYAVTERAALIAGMPPAEFSAVAYDSFRTAFGVLPVSTQG